MLQKSSTEVKYKTRKLYSPKTHINIKNNNKFDLTNTYKLATDIIRQVITRTHYCKIASEFLEFFVSV